MNTKYHFINANTKHYKDNNFYKLLKEEEKYQGYTYWNIGNHKIHTNDVCYIYYSDLPDNSSRILFVGKVMKSDLNNNSEKSIYPDAKSNEKYMKLKIKSVSLEDNSKFSLDSLSGKYNLIPKEQFSYLHIDLVKHKKLIEDIDEASSNMHYLKYVYEYFDENYCICEFGCMTFIEENGFHYIERHQLVERGLISKYSITESIDKIINNKSNLFRLCPTCYKKLHFEKKKQRMKMIEFLYNKNKQYFDNEYNQIKGNKDVLAWLYELYHCN